MSSSIQDQNMTETKVNDAPAQAPIEKGKGKTEDAMDDDEDDSESGEVSEVAQTHTTFVRSNDETDRDCLGNRRRAGRGGR
jgi:hypothetical protein